MKAGAAVELLHQQVARGMAGLPVTRKLLVGVSGGRDSVVLLHALLWAGFSKLVVVHINHCLRGRASGGDAAFVRRLAARLKVPVVVGRTDTRGYAAARGVSLELAARELRMAVYARAAKLHRTSHVVLGHHADDQAETCLFNYLRGSGTGGLTGMKSVSQFDAGAASLTIHRPMLAVRRDSIDQYVAGEGIAYRDDETNAQSAFTRNRFRHQVIPLLQEIMGDACVDAILRNAEILRAEHEYLNSLIDSQPLDRNLAVQTLRAMPLALQRRTVTAWLTQFGPPECGFAEVELVLRLVPKDAGVAKINLPCDYHCRRRAGEIFLEPPV